MRPPAQRPLAETGIALLLSLVGLLALATALPYPAGAQDETESPQGITRPQSPEAQAALRDLQSATKPGTRTALTEAAGCSFLKSASNPGCWAYWVLDAITDAIATLFVSLADLLFDAMVNFSMLDLTQTAFVRIGYGIVLGLANIFFILILLWIAIATIFDFEPFTARQLLGRLIIAALLINFSLPIARGIVNLANGMANVFYVELRNTPVKNAFNDRIPVLGTAIAQRVMLISNYPALKDTTPSNLTRVDGSNPAVQARIVQKCREVVARVPRLPGTGQAGAAAAQARAEIECASAQAQEVYEEALAISKSEDTLLKAFQALLWKIAFAVVVIFVLFTGAILLLVRQLSLAYIFIFGPAAFLFMILPYTRGFYNDWWNRLAKWSFFLPAFMFLLFLSLTVGNTLLPTVRTGEVEEKLPLIIQFGLAMGLLVGTFIVANQSSLYFAGTVTGWSKAAGKWAGKGMRGGAGRTALRFAAPFAKTVEEGRGGWVARTLGRVPGMPRLAQVTAATQRGQIAAREKNVDKFSNDELKRLIAMRGTTANTRAAALNVLQKRNDLRETPGIPGFDAGAIRSTTEVMRRVGANVAPIERLRPDIAAPRVGETQEQATRRAAGSASAADLENMDESVATHATLGAHAVQGIIDRAGSAHMRKIVERNDRLTREVMDAMDRLAAGTFGPAGKPSAAAIAAELRRRGNEGLARFVVSAPGRGLLDLDP